MTTLETHEEHPQGPSAEEAVVFDVQRFSVHDGPGIRTVVFFKGCGLDCRWCQNPEGRRATPELSYRVDRCIPGCRECVDSCPVAAIADRVADRIDWSACTHCGECVEPCPSGALEQVGQRWTPEALLEAVLADMPFYRRSGGGLTLSGGEPVLHAPFLARFLPLAKAAGLHVVLETGGQVRFDQLEPLLGWIDRVLFDVKAGGRARHRSLVGHTDEQILANLRALLERGAAGPEVEVRMPVVPGLNDGDESVAGIAARLRELGRLELTLLPYNDLWEAKLPHLDTPRAALGIRARPRADYDELIERFAGHGILARM